MPGEKETKEKAERELGDMPDSLAIGSASKDCLIKIYGDFNKVEEFKKKIANAAEVKKYAKANLSINV